MELRKVMFKEGWNYDGKPVARATLWTILRDPFYCGKFSYKGIMYKGKHEPLISEELYGIVQEKLRKGDSKFAKHNFLFRGLIKCQACGFSITYEKQKGHTYGHCTGHSGCEQKGVFIRAEEIERQIKGAFDELVIEDTEVLEDIKQALKESHEDEMTYHNQVLAEHRSDDEKRQLLSLVFSNLYLMNKTLYKTYAKPFAIVAERVKTSNLSGCRESNSV